jgi:hypothetical protein
VLGERQLVQNTGQYAIHFMAARQEPFPCGRSRIARSVVFELVRELPCFGAAPLDGGPDNIILNLGMDGFFDQIQ